MQRLTVREYSGGSFDGDRQAVEDGDSGNAIGRGRTIRDDEGNHTSSQTETYVFVREVTKTVEVTVRYFELTDKTLPEIGG